MIKGHVETNRDYWNDFAPHWVAAGEWLWARDTPVWGNWNTPDEVVTLLPADMTGLDAVELGCGTGYVAAWMTRRGAKVTAIDVSREQLATARRLAAKHGTDITFIEGNAETTGLPDATFDFAVSEYGAAIWCDPDLWLPEAFRLLRPGGRLAFLGTHPLAHAATPLSGAAADFTLHRPWRELERLDWSDAEVEPGGIEFNRSFAGWFDVFRRTGFRVLDYREIYATGDRPGVGEAIPLDWAQKYPSEQVWWLEKPA